MGDKNKKTKEYQKLMNRITQKDRKTVAILSIVGYIICSLYIVFSSIMGDGILHSGKLQAYLVPIVTIIFMLGFPSQVRILRQIFYETLYDREAEIFVLLPIGEREITRRKLKCAFPVVLMIIINIVVIFVMISLTMENFSTSPFLSNIGLIKCLKAIFESGQDGSLTLTVSLFVCAVIVTALLWATSIFLGVCWQNIAFDGMAGEGFSFFLGILGVGLVSLSEFLFWLPVRIGENMSILALLDISLGIRIVVSSLIAIWEYYGIKSIITKSYSLK